MDLTKMKISMPAFIVTVLLSYFGVALFGKGIGITVDATSPLVQTLINLTIAAASYFIGTSQGSAKKDDAAIASGGFRPSTTPTDKDAPQ